MATLRIERVNALPGTVTASTMYLVKSAEAGLADLYMTSSDGLDTRHIISKSEINTLIGSAVSSFNTVEIAADITARDALTLTVNQLVFVIDASADATVTAGSAMYVYDNVLDSFTKVSEYESLDLVLNWANLADKPSSSVADIDDAVGKKHTHANLTSLDKVNEDVNGDLTYDGDLINAGLSATEW